jgi:hypothetical protein
VSSSRVVYAARCVIALVREPFGAWNTAGMIRNESPMPTSINRPTVEHAPQDLLWAKANRSTLIALRQCFVLSKSRTFLDRRGDCNR